MSQFHYGSIKTVEYTAIYFILSASQFHYGSIKTMSKDISQNLSDSLNSTMVRLKLRDFQANIINSELVSIPLWFD